MKLVFDDFSNVCFIHNWTRMTSTLLLDLCIFMITNSLYSFQNQKCFFWGEGVRKIVKTRRLFASSCLSDCPLGKTRLRLEDFHEVSF